MWPAVLVLLSLSALAILPLLTMRRTSSLRSQVATAAEPARAQITRVQNAIALEAAATRGYLLTGDSAAVTQHLRARTNREQAIHELRRLSAGLGPGVRATTDELSTRLEYVEPLLDSLFGERLSRQEYVARFPRQQERLQAILSAAAAVDREVGRDVARLMGSAQRAETLGAVLTIVFVALALLAAALVARLNRQLHDSEERFRQITEAVHDFVWLSDKQFSRHLHANSAYERIWGRSRDELYADPASLLAGVHAEDRERVRHALAAVATTPSDIEFRVVRPDGQTRWVWSRAFAVRNARGEVYRIAGIAEDVTERKLANESRVRLIRGFTHDVKNPLGAADGYLALLQEGISGELTGQQADAVARARRSIKSALGLVVQLLDIARAEAGQLEVERVPVDVVDATREVVDEFRATAATKNLTLELEVHPSGEAANDAIRVESDPARVRQVLANLLSNAVKYTQAGGRVTITVGLEGGGRTQDESWVTVSVNDNGPGIPYEKQNMLFREFTRFNPNAAQGSGIGLAISQRVAHALEGKITFTSTPGAGSSFTFWLPRR